MQTLDWLETHVGSIEDGINLINRLHWYLTVETVKTREDAKSYWYVKGGEKVIFSADTHEAVDAFLYGMSLAYGSMPQKIVDDLIELTKE